MHAILSCNYTCSITAVDKSAWSQAEDTLIVTTQQELGNRWSHIAAMLPGRTENAVKVRFKSLARLSGASPNGNSRRGSSTTTSGTSGSSSSSSQSSAAVGTKKQRRSRSPASSSESDDDDLDDEEEEYVPRPTSRRQQQQQQAQQQQQQQQPEPRAAPQQRETARPQRLTAKKPQPVKQEQQLQVVKPEAQLQEQEQQQQQRAPAFDGMVSAVPLRYGTKRLCTEPVKQQQQQQRQRPLFELPGYTDEHVFAPALQHWRSADQSSVYSEQQHTYQQQLQHQQHYQYQQQQQLYYQHQQQLQQQQQQQQQYMAPYSFSSSAYAEPAAVVPAVDPVLQTAFSFDLFGVSEGLAPDLSCFEGQDDMGSWSRYCLA
jgi:Myb-like DNA-binding domain